MFWELSGDRDAELIRVTHEVLNSDQELSAESKIAENYWLNDVDCFSSFQEVFSVSFEAMSLACFIFTRFLRINSKKNEVRLRADQE